VLDNIGDILTIAMSDNARALRIQTATDTGAITILPDLLPISTGEPSVVFLDKHVNSVHPKLRMLQPTYSNEEGKFIEPGRRALEAIQETDELDSNNSRIASTGPRWSDSTRESKTWTSVSRYALPASLQAWPLRLLV
jgi:hypothetical protein